MAKAKTEAPASAPKRASAPLRAGALFWVIIRGYSSAVEQADEMPEFAPEQDKAEAKVHGPFDSLERAEKFRAKRMARNPAHLDTGEVR